MIAATPEKFESLQEILNYSSHHLNVNPVIIITHSAQKNGIYGLLPYLTHVYLSAVKSSVASLQAVLRGYQFEKPEKDAIARKLLSCEEQYCHLVLDVEARDTSFVKAERQEGKARPVLIEKTLEKKRPSSAYPTLRQQEEKEGKSLEGGEESTRAAAKRFLGVLENKEIALALYDLIVRKLPGHKLDSADLNLTLKSADNKDEVISLIDYIGALTSKRSKPDKNLIKLHRYLIRKGAKLPKSYVLNKRFW